MAADSKTVNPVSEALFDVRTTAENAQRQVAALSTQLERIKTVTNFDSRSAAVDGIKSQREVLQEVHALTQVVSLLTLNQSRNPELDMVNMSAELHHRMQEARTKEVASNLSNLRYLSTLRQVTTEKCSCGNHAGISFIAPNGTVIEENMCPKVWWIKQSRIAFEDGRLGQFTRNLPISDYLAAYKLPD